VKRPRRKLAEEMEMGLEAWRSGWGLCGWDDEEECEVCVEMGWWYGGEGVDWGIGWDKNGRAKILGGVRTDVRRVIEEGEESERENGFSEEDVEGEEGWDMLDSSSDVQSEGSVWEVVSEVET
jgi:hypothetical protein